MISSETSSPTASVCEADSNHDPPWMNKEHLEEEARKFCNEKDGKPVWSHGSGMGDDAVRTGGIPNKHEDKSEIIMSAEVSTAHECVAYRGNPLKNETCVAGMMTAINDCKFLSPFSPLHPSIRIRVFGKSAKEKASY